MKAQIIKADGVKIKANTFYTLKDGVKHSTIR